MFGDVPGDVPEVPGDVTDGTDGTDGRRGYHHHHHHHWTTTTTTIGSGCPDGAGRNGRTGTPVTGMSFPMMFRVCSGDSRDVPGMFRAVPGSWIVATVQQPRSNVN